MTIDEVLARPAFENLCAGDIRLLLEHGSFLDEIAIKQVKEINIDLLYDRHYCENNGINYSRPSDHVKNSEFTGRQILKAESIKLYLLQQKKGSISQLSRPQLKLPTVYRQVPE